LIFNLLQGFGIVKRKGKCPSLENLQDVDPIITTYFQFIQLKQLYRQGWLQAGVSMTDCETVAEHSLGVVLLTALLGLQMKEDGAFDLEKALLLALFHDFGEIYAGDFTPLDKIPAEKKHALELDAMRRVFDGLPTADTILGLWEEYEAGETAEANFVKQMDRMEMGLQASVYQQTGALEHAESFIGSMTKEVNSPALLTIVDEITKISQKG
jgi:5'-deoxynucleotidase YfbR-like HD superfamily hydrolase